MEITKVTYSRTQGITHSESECIAVSADIDIQEDASEVLAYLQNWTEQKLKVRETTAKLDARKYELQSDIFRLERDIEVARAKWEKVQKFLDKIGISDVDNIPF